MVMLVKYGGGSDVHEFGVDIDDTNLPSRREALSEISKPVAGVHARAKRLPPELVAQALDNEPFEDFPRTACGYRRVCDEGGEARNKFNRSYQHLAEGFLRRTFHSLTFIPGISFDIGQVSIKDERKSLDEAIAHYRTANMEGQVSSLEEAYDGLRALRMVFGNARERDCFSLETVVPSRYLPEILVAAPVWFIEPKVKPKQKSGGARSGIVRYFCDLGVTDQFAHLFQMYNRVPRYFDEFEGRDVMPLPITQLVSQVRNVFDFLVIATPYHDLAAKEWRDARWVRNIDPFLFGFLKQVPDLIFFLGRWSGTGLFPLTGEMIADTIEHIRKNMRFLRNFSNDVNWYRIDSLDYRSGYTTFGPPLRPVDEYKILSVSVSKGVNLEIENHTLVKFANNIIQQYEQGCLFSWLRGESRQR